MNILTVENNVYNLDSVRDEIDDFSRYCVLDVNDPEYIMIFCNLVFTKVFFLSKKFNIGGNEIQMPMD